MSCYFIFSLHSYQLSLHSFFSLNYFDIISSFHSCFIFFFFHCSPFTILSFLSQYFTFLKHFVAYFIRSSSFFFLVPSYTMFFLYLISFHFLIVFFFSHFFCLSIYIFTIRSSFSIKFLHLFFDVFHFPICPESTLVTFCSQLPFINRFVYFVISFLVVFW
jgi:hypothetical protein